MAYAVYDRKRHYTRTQRRRNLRLNPGFLENNNSAEWTLHTEGYQGGTNVLP